MTAWVEDTDRRVEVATDSQGFATVNKAQLLRGLSEYELWAMAYPLQHLQRVAEPTEVH